MGDCALCEIKNRPICTQYEWGGKIIAETFSNFRIYALGLAGSACSGTAGASSFRLRMFMNSSPVMVSFS